MQDLFPINMPEDMTKDNFISINGVDQRLIEGGMYSSPN